MNSTGVAIATSPCQPHHLHCLRVPGTPFLSPSLAPPQGTSGASAISHEATCGWLPACPRLPPSFPLAMPAHLSETHPGPPRPPQGSFLPLPSPPPMPQKNQEPQILPQPKAWRRPVLPPKRAALRSPTPGNSPERGRNCNKQCLCMEKHRFW